MCRLSDFWRRSIVPSRIALVDLSPIGRLIASQRPWIGPDTVFLLSLRRPERLESRSWIAAGMN